VTGEFIFGVGFIVAWCWIICLCRERSSWFLAHCNEK